MPIRSIRHRVRRGFTLIELVVVILILGILASLIVPRVVSRTSDAKIAKAKSDIAAISSMLNTFRADCDRYPSSQEGLEALRTQPADVQGWKGPYTTQNFTDPWGNPYHYDYPGPAGRETFTLESYGSDGQPGGEGDAADISADSP
ncbi:MAG: type II secretion system major pseudopilin GspG [Armatimonadetes bacterium]|nr:type II secretion system major pseudopilin GspG [Armatimonadota bacterium]